MIAYGNQARTVGVSKYAAPFEFDGVPGMIEPTECLAKDPSAWESYQIQDACPTAIEAYCSDPLYAKTAACQPYAPSALESRFGLFGQRLLGGLFGEAERRLGIDRVRLPTITPPGLSTGAKVGIVVGSVVAISAAVLIAGRAKKKRGRRAA